MGVRDANAIVICDLGFGDSGKGTAVDFLTRELGIKLIVRTGGPQAAHNVVTANNLRHCFAQFGSGTLVDGVRTYLSSSMLIAPDAFMNEFRALDDNGIKDALSRTYFNPDSVIVTPWHTMICQMLELERKGERHGSCGLGVGQAIYDSEAGLFVTVADILDGEKREAKLEVLFEAKNKVAQEILARTDDEVIRSRYDYFVTERSVDKLLLGYDFFADKIRSQVVDERVFFGKNTTPIIFEGSQGALLDRRYGFYPYITKSVTTHHNATEILASNFPFPTSHKLGILRAYGHRHGAGPFPTEDQGLGLQISDDYNIENDWQGRFRIGWLDLILLNYGIDVNNGVDSLCVTCLDQLSGLPLVKVCTSYDYCGDRIDIGDYFYIERSAGKPRRITGIKVPSENREIVGQILKECVPNYVTFPGWTLDKKVENFRSLPVNARKFLKFIEGTKGLNTPISIISIGPRSDQKIFK